MAIREETRKPARVARIGRARSGPISVPINALRMADGFRYRLNIDHARALAEYDGEVPPILVSQGDYVVIDGAHRVHAAKLQGRTEICCEVFDGSDADAFIEFVQRNVSHGLPLTLAERRAAARRILAIQPDWSDRRIAATCALSPGAVGRMRSGTPTGDIAERRIGRDGRSRPRDPQAVRGRIVAALTEDPHAPLRAIALRTGSSPETVRSVRLELGSTPKPVPDPHPEPTSADLSPHPGEKSGLEVASDVAFTSTPEGTRFALWFSATNIDGSWRDYVDNIPLSKVYEIADEARRRASFWSEFARSVENRARPATPVAR